MKPLLMKTFFVAAFAFLLSACSSGTTASSTPPDVSGTTYSGTLNPSTFSARSIQITLIQTDGAVTGQFIVSNFAGCLEGGTISGTISGNNIEFAVTDASGATLSFTGTATNNSIEGSFSATGATTTAEAASAAAETPPRSIPSCNTTGNFSGTLSVTR